MKIPEKVICDLCKLEAKSTSTVVYPLDPHQQEAAEASLPKPPSGILMLGFGTQRVTHVPVHVCRPCLDLFFPDLKGAARHVFDAMLASRLKAAETVCVDED